MKELLKKIQVLIISVFMLTNVNAQFCDSLVPSLTVDLSANPNMSWQSLSYVRDGSCCGSVAPDVCTEFVITLHPDAIAVEFNIVSGAVPPGALFYQIDCGPITLVGDPICLTGVGPHNLTFCKPGNNPNAFSITSFSNPVIGPDISLNAACQGFIHANFYNEPSMSWTSIAPGVQGAYDSYLSCLSGCDTTYVTAPVNAPAYVDYLVCGMDLPGCNPNPICDTIRVTFIPPVTVTVSPDITVCPDVTSVQLVAQVSGGTGPYSILWNTAETNDTINVGPGIYTVQVTDASGCHVAIANTTVSTYPLPNVDAGLDQIICIGPMVTLSAAGAASYVWDNGVINNTPFNAPIGTTTYTVIGTDMNGCTNTDQVDVTINPLPIVNAGTDQTVCDGVQVTLSGSGAVSYAWNNGVIDGVPFNSPIGITNYTVIGTDGNGCTNTDNVDITVNALPIVIAGVDQQMCDGFTATVSGAGAVSYTWNNGVIDGISFNSPIGTTNYIVTGTDANGCQNTDNLDVTVYALPIIVANAINTSVCDGQSATLTGSGGTSYLWDNGVLDGVSFIPPTGVTTYTVTGTDLNGCINTDQIDITVFNLPVVVAGLDQTVCDGVQVTLSGSGAVSYAWNNGVIDGVPFSSPIGTTNYTVIGTDGNGCTNTDNVDVIVNALPIVSAGIDQQMCDGFTATVSGSGAVSYTWNNGVIDGIAFNSPIGTTNYIVTGTDANGCQSTDNLDVTVYALPIIVANAINTSVCDGQSATLTGSGGTSYLWDNGVLDGVSFIPPTGVTTYTVTGTDLNGCINTDQIDITVFNLPVVVAGLDQTVCDGVQVTLSGSGAVSYAWNNGVIDGVAFNSPIGTTNYTVIGTDGNGCTNTDNLDVTVNTLPIVVAGIDQTVCDGFSVSLSGSGAVSYTWNNGVIDGIAFNSPIGTTNYIVTGADANGCQNTDNANVTVHALPNVNAGSDIQICDGGSVVLAASGAILYNWTGGVIDNVAFTPFVGQYQYVVTGTDINGCVNTDAVDVTVNPNPVVNAGSDQTMCENDFVTLNSAGTTNLYWNNGVINNVPFQQVVGVMTYVVYDSYPTGCSASDTVQIEVFVNPTVSTSDVEICEGESVILTGNGALSYDWSNGILDGLEFYPFESAVFTVTGYNAEGCSSTADALVSVNMSPTANFTWTNTELSTNNPTTGFNNLSIGGASFLWDFNDFTPNSSSFEPIHTFPIEEGNGYAVTLTVTSSAGCVAEIQQYIDVKQDFSIYVPNTFTPDANGVNEIFNPILVGFDEQDYTLYIFNRWGQLVFESHDMSIGWNGTYAAGQFDNVQDGAFTWKVVARVKNTADKKQFVGHVALLK